MGVVTVIRHLKNIGAAAAQDVVFGARGGILLQLRLSWAPLAYHDKGNPGESFVIGDIHCLILDSINGQSILNQRVAQLDTIVVPTGEDWVWVHPEKDALIGSEICAKLAVNTAFPAQPPGVIQQNLRIGATWDPNKNVSHSLVIEGIFLAFDSVAL
jgi:hypothetical protein